MSRYPRETAESKLFDTIVGGLGRLFRRKGGPTITGTPIDRQYIQAEWQKIQEAMTVGGESRYQQAVISADKILDYVLKARIAGETMGDRLKNATTLFSNRDTYQAAWDGHKLRNRLVHETNYQTVSWEAKRAIQDYERALRDLGVL